MRGGGARDCLAGLHGRVRQSELRRPRALGVPGGEAQPRAGAGGRLPLHAGWRAGAGTRGQRGGRGRPAVDASLFLPLPAAGDPRVLHEVRGDESRCANLSIQHSAVHQRDIDPNRGALAFHRTLRGYQRFERRLGQLPGAEPMPAGTSIHVADRARCHLRAGAPGRSRRCGFGRGLRHA